MADVTLRQLRYFAVLGEELNYQRAAERLFITQPALSTAIKQLEQAFGNGEPGPITVAIRDRFWALMDEPGPRWSYFLSDSTTPRAAWARSS